MVLVAQTADLKIIVRQLDLVRSSIHKCWLGGSAGSGGLGISCVVREFT